MVSSPCSEPAVIIFHDVVRVPLQDAPSARHELVEDPRIDRRAVGGDLEGSGTERRGSGEEARGGAVAALREQHVDHLAVLIDSTVEVGPAAGYLDVGFIDEPAIAHRVPG